MSTRNVSHRNVVVKGFVGIWLLAVIYTAMFFLSWPYLFVESTAQKVPKEMEDAFDAHKQLNYLAGAI